VGNYFVGQAQDIASFHMILCWQAASPAPSFSSIHYAPLFIQPVFVPDSVVDARDSVTIHEVWQAKPNEDGESFVRGCA